MAFRQTSQKHKDFVREPMQNRPIEDVAGIGLIYGLKLREIGFTKASILLGKFLVMDLDCEEFHRWLVMEIGFSHAHADATIYCLKVWCENNL